MKLKDKVAIVTGAAQGIGWGVVQLFHREGASVVLADLDADKLNSRLEELNSDRVSALQVDVSREEDVEKLYRHLLERHSRLDILVACAGILRPAMLHKMDLATWQKVVDVHLSGSFLCARMAARHWIQRWKEGDRPQGRSFGKLVLVSSIAGLRGSIGQVNYSASKAGILGLTMSAARELGRYQVNVNAIAFGVVETQMTEKIRTDEKFRQIYLQQTVLGRFATVDEVTPAVLFLASADSDYMTGQVLCIDGGIHIGL